MRWVVLQATVVSLPSKGGSCHDRTLKNGAGKPSPCTDIKATQWRKSKINSVRSSMVVVFNDAAIRVSVAKVMKYWNGRKQRNPYMCKSLYNTHCLCSGTALLQTWNEQVKSRNWITLRCAVTKPSQDRKMFGDYFLFLLPHVFLTSGK